VALAGAFLDTQRNVVLIGGTGTGSFVHGDSAVELATRTFRPTPHHDELESLYSLETESAAPVQPNQSKP
jgi:hypothetical protein